jgi:hypothetical protein
MIVCIEGFDQNNNFINLNIDTKNKKIKYLGKWAHYEWYKNGIQLSRDYNDWRDDETYEVIYNNDFINLYIKINNKIIMTPLICKSSTIKELKNILSIKDNIYFKHNKLQDNNTLEDYDINNMDILTNIVYSSSALESC